jgi:hypothetical protein
MATYDTLYAVVNYRKTKRSNAAIVSDKPRTLYEAQKRLIELRKEGLVTDATHIRCQGRPVAFFCDYKHSIRSMFGANEQERTVIGEDRWFLASKYRL